MSTVQHPHGTSVRRVARGAGFFVLAQHVLDVTQIGSPAQAPHRTSRKGVTVNDRLPSVIDRYYSAVNARRIDLLMDCFTPNAIVNDRGEKQTLGGRDSIRAWASAATAAYEPSVDVRTFARRDDGTISVNAEVTGTFPGSPLPFVYDFTIVAGRIVHLDIDQR